MTAYDFVDVRLESSEFTCDNVQVTRLDGREAISELFSFDLAIVCLKPGELSLDAMLGSDVSLVFVRRAGDKETEVRRIHGMVVEATDKLDTETEFETFHIRVAPRAHRLTLIQTQQVFLDISVPDIIKKKLELVGLEEDTELRLMGTYEKREIVVQYRETDLAFISRLAEHLGISFFFEHDSGTDKIIFTDQKSGYRPAEHASTATFRPRGDRCDVYRLEATKRLVPSSFVTVDYNYRTPQLDLTGRHELGTGYAGGIVEYAPHHTTPEEGMAIAKARAEEQGSRQLVYAGESDQPQLSAGVTFTLEGHKKLEDNTLLVVDIEHHAQQVAMVHGGSGTEVPYRNTFHAIDAKLTYRPPRKTPRPRIHGVLTARIEPGEGGSIGEFAKLDEDGRYTVKFYFDSGESEGPFSSSRVRMIQPHAGEYYGLHMPLKPGIEVLMIFMDGDPDRPLIVGSVPNPITPSPVTKDNATMSRIKTVSGIIIEMKDRG
jgi:type VI secretion system secreted protein VgrG